MGIEWFLMCILLWSTFGMVHIGAAQKQVFATEGKDALLPCTGPGRTKVSFQWLYETRSVVQIHYTGMPRYGSGYSNNRITTFDYNKGNYSIKLSKLTMPDGGTYKCTSYSSELDVIKLHVIKVTSPDGEHYLHLTDVKLKCDINPPISENLITWLNPKGESVSSSSRYHVSDGDKTLDVRNIQIQESGQWRCRVKDAEAYYTVQVLGISDRSQSVMVYTSVNQSAILPLELTQDIKNSKFGNFNLKKGELLRLKEEGGRSTALALLNNSQQKLFWEETDKIQNEGSGHSLSIRLVSASFQDAGRYRFHLTFDKGTLQNDVHLVVLQVTASPEGKIAEKDTVNLTCQVSNNTPPLKLVWKNMNDTSKKVEGQEGVRYLTISLTEKTQDQFDVWTCNLMENSEVKASAEYKLEPKEDNSFLGGIPQWVFFTAGSLVLLILFIIGCILFCTSTNNRRQRRERRISMMRHVLDPQRTCQCHKMQYELYRP
ncbi:uncharacterized protein LOC122808646 [Protopterus annectens]|uniref:uncharacterized protein LOC122808646 n=1 Tax=Protopterus annectens TaxID=7888 RepID=UPI001CF9E7BD|nr:uncharacterized protein LOC122808646 [Protopterus annectens]XP_043935550.1 uncharacterized protein LOC122808646 [Protopterus annectens]XP_043935551.1 uncharacterized protein LOC122808646 [Protopterus annectens]